MTPKTSLQKMRTWIVLAIAAIGVTACAPSGKIKVDEEKPSPAARVNTKETNPDGADAVKDFLNDYQFDESKYVVHEPGSQGYEEVEDLTPAANPGDLVDTALANIEPTWVDCRLNMLDDNGEIVSKPQIKIKDEKTFSFEYGLPETKGLMNKLVGNGTKRGLWEDGKVKMLPTFGKTQNATFDKQAIGTFIMRMPVDGFRYFQDGTKVWGPLVRALYDPKNGYKVTTEKQETTPDPKLKGMAGQENRTFFRIIAKSTAGPKSELEIVIDTKRNLPVTFKGTHADKKGVEHHTFWTGIWAFGGKHKPDDFKIPTVG